MRYNDMRHLSFSARIVWGRRIWGNFRFYGTTSNVPPASKEFPVRRMMKRFPVNVGCQLKIDVTGSTEVDIGVGENLEEISFEAEWYNPTAKAENTEGFIKFQATEDFIEVYENDAIEGCLSPERINFKIPERWCSVSVHTWEGSVSLASVTEANVEISTDGANVYLGKIKGAKTQISTNGGTITAQKIFSDLVAESKGGDVKFGQILGNNVEIFAQKGGKVALESTYGEKLLVNCGQFHGNSINSQKFQVNSENDVKISGLEGEADIFSENGPIEIQVLEGLKKATLKANKGNIFLFVPQNYDAFLKLKAIKTLENESKLSEKTEANEISLPEIKLNAPNSQVEIKERSWMESITAKISFQ